jgi:hypothetical protein
MLATLLYVSRSNLSAAAMKPQLPELLSSARSRNAALDTTGALVFTGDHFVQVLEGPVVALEVLMTSISSDLRHREVQIALQEPIATRQFDGWSMAYAGPAEFVRRRVEPLVAAASPEHPLSAQRRTARLLIQLMCEFCDAASRFKPGTET